MEQCEKNRILFFAFFFKKDFFTYFCKNCVPLFFVVYESFKFNKTSYIQAIPLKSDSKAPARLPLLGMYAPMQPFVSALR